MKANVIGVAAVVLLSAFPALAGARERLHAAHDRCGAESADAKLARTLNLSDEQVTRVHGLRTAYLREQQAMMQTFRSARMQLREARKAGASQDEIRASLRSARMAMRKLDADLARGISEVLTDEQRALWEAMKPGGRPRRAAR